MASRREAERIIVAGRVRVDGEVVRTLGTRVEDGATVTVDGKAVEPQSVWTYIVAHKPFGMVPRCTIPKGAGRLRV